MALASDDPLFHAALYDWLFVTNHTEKLLEVLFLWRLILIAFFFYFEMVVVCNKVISLSLFIKT